MDMMLDTDRGQFDCPLCKRLSNLLIPVMNRTNTQMKADKEEKKVQEDDDVNRKGTYAHVMEGVEDEGVVQDRGNGPQYCLSEEGIGQVETSAAMRGAVEVRKRKTVSISSHSDGADNSIEETLRTAHESQRPALSSRGCDTVGSTVTSPMNGDHGVGRSMKREEEGGGGDSACRNQSSEPLGPYPMDANVVADTETDTGGGRKERERSTYSTFPASVPIPLWIVWIRDPRLVKKNLIAPTGASVFCNAAVSRNTVFFLSPCSSLFLRFCFSPS